MRGYDDWKLASPDDDACPHCQGWKKHDCLNCGGDGDVADGVECPCCDGSGEVECGCQEEPDGDYLYERRRDRMMEQ